MPERPPHPLLRSTAQDYNARHKLPRLREGTYLPLDRDFGRRTARAYEDLDTEPDDESRQAYADFAGETDEQYEHLRRAGFHFTPSKTDPYPASGGQRKMELARRDVDRNKNLNVFASSLEHPILTNQQNWKFRGVHDLFGHTAEGYSIGPRGEYNAAVKHSQMYSPSARRAMLSETHGQNSVVNFSDTKPEGWGDRSIADINRDKPGTIYAEQKGRVLPASIITEFEGRMAGIDRPHGLFRKVRS